MMDGHKIGGPNTGGIEIPPLRIPEMLQTDTIETTGGEAELSTLSKTYLEMQRVEPDVSGAAPLRFKPPQVWGQRTADSQAGGTPTFFTIVGTKLKVDGSASLICTYYQRLATPAENDDTNAVFATAPQLYLFGMLAEAYDQIRNADRAQYYAAQFAGGIAGQNRSGQAGQISGGELVSMPDNTP
jgi:hypothetical protein